MDFAEWKSRAMAKLMKLAAEAKSQREQLELTELIVKLKDLRRRDAATWLYKLYAYCINFGKMNLCKEVADELEKVEDEDDEE